MKCENCGREFDVGDQYCQICGTKRNVQIVSEKKGLNAEIISKFAKYFSLAVTAFTIILFIKSITITNLSDNSDNLSDYSSKLVCHSYNNMIAIFYNEDKLEKYLSYNYDLDLDLDFENSHAKELGIDNYIYEFKDKYTSNHIGSCEVYEKCYNEKYESSTSMNIVGDDNFGYLYVPIGLTKDENSNKYYNDNISVGFGIINDYSKDLLFSAASDFLNNVRISNKYDEIKSSQTDVGKREDYDAYEVYMFDNSNNKIIVYYFFVGESDYVHFISLECDKDSINEYLFIPRSYDTFVG